MIKRFKHFNNILITESVKFGKAAYVRKLKQKLLIAKMAIDKWSESDFYQKTYDKILDVIEGRTTFTYDNAPLISGDVPKTNYEIFIHDNTIKLAEHINTIIKKYKKYEVKASSVPAGPNSATFRAIKDGNIMGRSNMVLHGGYYDIARRYIICVTIGGGIDLNIEKKLCQELFEAFYIFDEYNGIDGGISYNYKSGTAYSTIGLTCSKYSFKPEFAKELENIMNKK